MPMSHLLRTYPDLRHQFKVLKLLTFQYFVLTVVRFCLRKRMLLKLTIWWVCITVSNLRVLNSRTLHCLSEFKRSLYRNCLCIIRYRVQIQPHFWIPKSILFWKFVILFIARVQVEVSCFSRFSLLKTLPLYTSKCGNWHLKLN